MLTAPFVETSTAQTKTAPAAINNMLTPMPMSLLSLHTATG
jgi:hypothetical protein